MTSPAKSAPHRATFKWFNKFSFSSFFISHDKIVHWFTRTPLLRSSSATAPNSYGPPPKAPLFPKTGAMKAVHQQQGPPAPVKVPPKQPVNAPAPTRRYVPIITPLNNIYLSCWKSFTFTARWHHQHQHLVWHFNQNCELHWVALNRMLYTSCLSIKLPNFNVKALYVLHQKGCRQAMPPLPFLAAVVTTPIRIALLLWLELKPKGERMLNRDCRIVRNACLIYVVLGNILLNLWSFYLFLKQSNTRVSLLLF
jgi:hypothetical protein